MIVVAMIWILGATGVWYLDRQPLSLNTSIAQFDAMLNLARTHASVLAGGTAGANSGTAVVAGTGATLYVEPDANDPLYSMATLYWLRPIQENPCGGCVSPDPSIPPLHLHAMVTANIPSSGSTSTSSFAVFLSPSQHLSLIEGGTTDDQWQPTGRKQAYLSGEPACDPSHPPTLTFSENGNEMTGILTCSGSWLRFPSPRPAGS